MPHKGEVLAAAAGAAAAAGTYVAYKSLLQTAGSVVVFLDSSKTGVRLQRCCSLDLLKGQVESKLHVYDCQLFLAQVG